MPIYGLVDSHSDHPMCNHSFQCVLLQFWVISKCGNLHVSIINGKADIKAWLNANLLRWIRFVIIDGGQSEIDAALLLADAGAF